MQIWRDRVRALSAAVLAWPALASAESFPRDDIVVDPAPGLFSVCHGNGCRDIGFASLTPQQWQAVRSAFQPIARDAAEERGQLRVAIALMETHAGAATGTWRDRRGTFNVGDGQMDCIDESINTTLYLTMFERYGLMRLHRVERHATRGWFLGGWPHTTAVIAELAAAGSGGAGGDWAVDSWFLDNGQPPFIVPLGEWRAGWAPGQ